MTRHATKRAEHFFKAVRIFKNRFLVLIFIFVGWKKVLTGHLTIAAAEAVVIAVAVVVVVVVAVAAKELHNLIARRLLGLMTAIKSNPSSLDFLGHN